MMYSRLTYHHRIAVMGVETSNECLLCISRGMNDSGLGVYRMWHVRRTWFEVVYNLSHLTNLPVIEAGTDDDLYFVELLFLGM